MKTIEEQINGMIPEWVRLIKSLKPTIGDDYRAYDDCDGDDDSTPSMLVTVGFTPETEDKDCSWSYQTGDNSYTGGAYGHPHWGVVAIHRKSNSNEVANEIAEEIGNLIAQ